MKSSLIVSQEVEVREIPRRYCWTLRFVVKKTWFEVAIENCWDFPPSTSQFPPHVHYQQLVDFKVDRETIELAMPFTSHLRRWRNFWKRWHLRHSFIGTWWQARRITFESLAMPSPKDKWRSPHSVASRVIAVSNSFFIITPLSPIMLKKFANEVVNSASEKIIRKKWKAGQ